MGEESRAVARLLLTTPVSGKKAQSAIEYLTTYSWAILILAIALALFVTLNVFNPNAFAPNKCTPPADFTCTNATISRTGSLALTVGQSTTSPIYITAIGCNTNVTTKNIHTYAGLGLFLPIGSNVTTTVQCYAGGSAYSGGVGSLFTGYLIINYTNINTGFSQTSVGSVAEKVAH